MLPFSYHTTRRDWPAQGEVFWYIARVVTSKIGMISSVWIDHNHNYVWNEVIAQFRNFHDAKSPQARLLTDNPFFIDYLGSCIDDFRTQHADYEQKVRYSQSQGFKPKL